MKLKIIALFSASLIFNSTPTLALSKGQGLACEAILCAVGIAIPESHNECRKVLTEWSIYLATLGFFRSKPKCPKKDPQDVVTGLESMECSSINNSELRNLCYQSNQPEQNCDKYSYGSPSWHSCEKYQCKNQSGYYGYYCPKPPPPPPEPCDEYLDGSFQWKKCRLELCDEQYPFGSQQWLNCKSRVCDPYDPDPRVAEQCLIDQCKDSNTKVCNL
ncbi:hypothetical protein [Pseudoalteromonas sp. Of11M-6]|uniref:hypothetical protein n=1 Tax=Pseudoalteromonas sp. Of11M-6 TaxID=2917754 RepID=UPI001EF602EA|nr:hypothetical protein [Pseudoalteromonas sp. Of11M-6]MCG7556083.1 hypothetical protein [Pseudoalteromonas sp. Of11M-6]